MTLIVVLRPLAQPLSPGMGRPSLFLVCTGTFALLYFISTKFQYLLFSFKNLCSSALTSEHLSMQNSTLSVCSFLKTSHELKVFPYTQLHIVCPNTWTILKRWKGQVPETNLYENIWRVDESGYKTCSTGTATSQPALIMLCDSPTKVKFDTFVFQFPADSPTTFPPGKEYFFIGKRS